VLLLALSTLAPISAHADQVKVWATGAYSFSDELGGFRITGASGTGTKEDPLVITEELNSSTPVTLTIRTTKPIQAFGKDDSGLLLGMTAAKFAELVAQAHASGHASN